MSYFLNIWPRIIPITQDLKKTWINWSKADIAVCTKVPELI